MIYLIIFVSLFWAACGIYGVCANIERIPRIWKCPASEGIFQHVCTFFLGPLGIMTVLDAGGKWDWWRKQV